MYKIKLDLEKRSYDLVNCYYSCYNAPPSPTSEDYTPNPYPHSMSWGIKQGKMDQDLLDWCTLPDQSARSGKITIMDAETNAVVKVIAFQNAFCSGFNESADVNYDYYNQSPTTISLMVQNIGVRILNAGKGVSSPN